jgi:hypothetical protein
MVRSFTGTWLKRCHHVHARLHHSLCVSKALERSTVMPAEKERREARSAALAPAAGRSKSILEACRREGTERR